MAYATTSMSLTHRWHSHTHTSPRARLISFCLSACERACAMAPRGRLLEYVHVCVCVYVCEWVSECVCLCAVGRGAKSSSPFGLIVAPPSFPSPWISSFSLSFSCFNFTLLSLSFSTFLRIASSLSLLSSLSPSLSLSLSLSLWWWILHYTATAVWVALSIILMLVPSKISLKHLWAHIKTNGIHIINDIHI